jgi:hypothetical protein
MKLCKFAANVKEARIAANQPVVERDAECRARGAAWLIFANATARIAYLVVGNSWPMVAIAHGVGFCVEILEVGVKYYVEGHINLALPQV